VSCPIPRRIAYTTAVNKAVVNQAPKAVLFDSPRNDATITAIKGGRINPRNIIKSVKRSVVVSNGRIPLVVHAAPGKVKMGAKIIVIINIISVVGKVGTVKNANNINTVFNPK
jgi:hypothetical protein